MTLSLTVVLLPVPWLRDRPAAESREVGQDGVNVQEKRQGRAAN